MKKLLTVLIASLMLISSGCMKSPMDRGESLGTVETLSEEGVLTTMDARVYEQQLQAQIVMDCRSYQREQLQMSYAAIGELETGMERLVAIVSNQWKEAVIAMEGEDYCEAGTNEYDAYIAYAEAQGKIYEVVIGEIGKTFRFGVGAVVAGNVANSLIKGIGDSVQGDKLTGGHNAVKTQDQATATVSSTESTEINRISSSNRATQVGTENSSIDNPNASNSLESNAAGVEGTVPEEITEEFCNSQGLTLRESTGECITWEFRSNLENERLIEGFNDDVTES
jgi:hypothetical protein